MDAPAGSLAVVDAEKAGITNDGSALSADTTQVWPPADTLQLNPNPPVVVVGEGAPSLSADRAFSPLLFPNPSAMWPVPPA